MSEQELEAIRARVLEAGKNASYTDLATLLKEDRVLAQLVSTCMRALIDEVRISTLRPEPFQATAA